MSSEKPIVSPSPHLHGRESTRRVMGDVLIALLPVTLVALLCYGWSVLILLLSGVAACVLCEYLINRFLLHRPCSVGDLSAIVTGVLLVLNLPPAAPWWIAVVGAVVAIGIAKMTFGGLGQNLFNPALVGRVFLLVSFPVLMTGWALPHGILQDWIPMLSSQVDAFSGATPLGVVKEGLINGGAASELAGSYTWQQLLFIRPGGSVGELSSIALLLGFIYLLCRRVIKATIPVTIVATVFVLSAIFSAVDPARFTGPFFNVFTGGLLLGAIFMATDYVTSPMTTLGQIIYGVGIGVIALCIRYFGSYPEGVSFSILIMNCVVPILNKYCKPRRFGKEAK